MKLKNKSQITTWLEAGELRQVLDELKLQLKASRTDNDFLKTATSLSAQLEKVKTDKMKGIITYDEETIAMNKLLDKVQIFVEKLENHEPEAKAPKNQTIDAPIKPPPNAPKTIDEAPSNAWKWWAAIIVIMFGVWWIFFHNGPIKPTIRICTSQSFSDLNWCNNDLPRFTLAEVQQQGLMVSAGFEGGTTKDPYVTGDLEKSDGTVFPTENIILTLADGGVGYACKLQPTYGAIWEPGTYILKLSYNKKPVGEKLFEIIGETTKNNNIRLLPLDSFKVKPRNPITRLDSLLQQQ